MKKRALVLALAALLLFFGCPAAASSAPVPDPPPFTDVPETVWYYPYVADLYARGVIDGVGGSRFAGNDTVTWGQAFKLILLAIGAEEPEPIPGQNWAKAYIQPAIDNRLVYSFDEAALGMVPPRSAVARMVARAMDLTGIAGESPYADFDDGYAVELFEKGIMEGEVIDGERRFLPEEGITRAEMAAIVWRVMESDYAGSMTRVSNYWVDLFEDVPASPFAPEQFTATEDGRMRYDGGRYALGVDVSEHKGEIDWEAVAADGVEFAIIRVGGRLMQSGDVFEDKYAKENIEGAKAAGLKVGAYFFSQALNAEEGLEEAEFALNTLAGCELDLPVVCDWEYLGGKTSRTWLADAWDITAGIDAFCQRVEQEGYEAGVYFNEYCGMIKMDLSRLKDYAFWYAEYASAPRCVYGFDFWQFSDHGKVDGIGSNVDLDLWFLPGEGGEAPEPEGSEPPAPSESPDPDGDPFGSPEVEPSDELEPPEIFDE